MLTPAAFARRKPRGHCDADDWQRTDGGVWLPRVAGDPMRGAGMVRRGMGFGFEPAGCCCGSIVWFENALTQVVKDPNYELKRFGYETIEERLSSAIAVCLGTAYDPLGSPSRLNDDELDAVAAWIQDGGKVVCTAHGFSAGDPDAPAKWNAIIETLGGTITIGYDAIDGWQSWTTTNINSAPGIMAGVESIRYSVANSVAGGTWLMKTVTGGIVFGAIEGIGDGAVLVIGSYNAFSSGYVNSHFFDNFFTLPVADLL